MARGLIFIVVIDIFIVGSVLVLFVVAEAKRCCIESGDDTSTRSLRDLGEIGYNYDYESECTCTDWGTRTYSGIIQNITHNNSLILCVSA